MCPMAQPGGGRVPGSLLVWGCAQPAALLLAAPARASAPPARHSGVCWEVPAVAGVPSTGSRCFQQTGSGGLCHYLPQQWDAARVSCRPCWFLVLPPGSHLREWAQHHPMPPASATPEASLCWQGDMTRGWPWAGLGTVTPRAAPGPGLALPGALRHLWTFHLPPPALYAPACLAEPHHPRWHARTLTATPAGRDVAAAAAGAAGPLDIVRVTPISGGTNFPPLPTRCFPRPPWQPPRWCGMAVAHLAQDGEAP